MNLKQLEIFVTVAKYESFSRAARELFLTQPTVSAHILSLEEELHTQLFVRSTKEVKLTKEGVRLMEIARKMKELEDEIYREFCQGEEEEAYTLTIAASTIPGQYVLPKLLAAFRKKNPKIYLEMIEGDSERVAELVLNGTVEVGFAGTMTNRRRCVNIPFYRDRLVVLTPNNEEYRRMEGDFPLEAFGKGPVIMREDGSGTRKETEQFLLEKGVDPERLNVVATFSRQETIKKSVEEGMGIAILSEASVEEEKKQGRLLTFPLAQGPLERDLYIITAKRGYTSPQAKKLIQFIQRVREVKA